MKLTKWIMPLVLLFGATSLKAQTLHGIICSDTEDARIGSSCAKDYAEAASWFRRAAEQGEATAQFNLGYLMYKGLGVETDRKQALVWLRKASRQGNEKAKAFLRQIGER